MRKCTSIMASAIVLGSTTLLNGCSPILAGSGALGASMLQERSVGDAVNDITIRGEINSFYIQTDVNNIFPDVSIEVHEGRVLLTGQVTDPAYRVEAVRLAWQPRGVKEVINEIEVTSEESSPKQFAADAWISTQAKAKLLLNNRIRSINYTVDTVNSTVYLMGVAQNEEELAEATYEVSIVRGVKRVVSHVRLKDDPKRH